MVDVEVEGGPPLSKQNVTKCNKKKFDLQRFRGRGEQSHWAGPVGAVVKKNEAFTSKQSSEKEENQTGYIIKENFAKS